MSEGDVSSNLCKIMRDTGCLYLPKGGCFSSNQLHKFRWHYQRHGAAFWIQHILPFMIRKMFISTAKWFLIGRQADLVMVFLSEVECCICMLHKTTLIVTILTGHEMCLLWCNGKLIGVDWEQSKQLLSTGETTLNVSHPSCKTVTFLMACE